MRILRRELALFLGCALMLSVTGCSHTDTAESVVDVESMPESISIAGVPLADYTIIFADHPYNPYSPDFAANLYTDYDFYASIAERIAERIQDITGVSLPVERDRSTEEVEYEILVGPTNRRQSDILDSMDVHDYVCKVDGTKLVIGGGYDSTPLTGKLKTSYCFASTFHAWDYMEEYIAQNGVNREFDLDADFSLSGSREINTVACIGDSITEGHGSYNFSFCSYPAVLQRLLWQDYLILNYGLGGKTMRNDLDNAYKGTPQYEAAIENAGIFDVALIMLGTNDSASDSVWTKDDDKRFNDSALDLAAALTKSNKDMKLVIMNCPAYYGSGKHCGLRILELQGELADLLKQEGYDAYFYDMHTFTDTYLGASRYPDKLHPNNEGYFIMAGGLAEMLPSLLAGTWSQQSYDSDEKNTQNQD